MPLRTGAEVAEADSQSFSKDRLTFLSIKENEAPHIVRFYDDHRAWPVADIHILVATKPRPANRAENQNWPKSMTCTCQNDRGFRIEVNGQPTDEWEKGMGACYIHANYGDKKDNFGKPQSRARTTTHARVILRKKVGDEIVDQMEERELADGTKLMLPKIRVIAATYSSVFAPVKASAWQTNTVCSMDYQIHKSGKDTIVAPGSPDSHRPGSESWAAYDAAFEKLGDAADLVGMINYQASEEWYKRWYISGEWDEKKPDAEGAGAGTAVTAGSDLSADEQAELDAYRERLKGSRAAASSGS